MECSEVSQQSQTSEAQHSTDCIEGWQNRISLTGESEPQDTQPGVTGRQVGGGVAVEPEERRIFTDEIDDEESERVEEE